MRSLDRLAASLKRLPGIGPKQAERISLHLLRAPDSDVEALISNVRAVKAEIKLCPECYDLTDGELCRICADPSREASLLCVVEEPQDVVAIERSQGFHGRYHVLHGALSPLDGVEPGRLRLAELIERVKAAEGKIGEVILATDPDTEGEATALYAAELLKPLSVKITRIAHGVPLGGDLDYIDERTLSHALSGRREMEGGS
jgi:recombination protein RecR